MKHTFLSTMFAAGTLLVATPAMAQYVFTCVPPTEHAIGAKAPNVMAILDTSGSMGATSGEDVDGGGDDSKMKVASLALKDVANSIYTPGACTSATDPNCDSIRLGLGFFGGSSASLKEACGEDTTPAIKGYLPPGTNGITPTHKAMELLNTTPSLNDNTRPNLAVIITDGEPTGSYPAVASIDLAVARDAFTKACVVANRANNPVTIYMVGFGSGSFPAINSAMAAAGNTGHCCGGGVAAPCAAADQVDVCALGAAGLIKTNTTLQPGYSCAGSFEATGSDIKDALLTVFAGAGCVFPLDIPPGYPTTGANPDQDATEVTIYHALGGPITVPPANRGDILRDDLVNDWGVSAAIADTYIDEGWEFTNTDRKFIRLTPKLCDDILNDDVTKVTTEVACACPLAGQPCTINPGTFTPSQLAVMRCSSGIYECNGSTDVCVASAGAMPETCNGLDDDCDGSVDNLADSWAKPAYSGVTLPANRTGIDCGRVDVCMCPSNAKDDLAGTDLASYFAAWDPVCQCGEGLMAEPIDHSSLAQPAEQGDSAPSEQGQADGAACSSVAAGGPDLALLLLAALGLIRRKTR